MTPAGDTQLPMSGRSQPTRDDIAREERLTVVRNALAESLLAGVRDARTGTVEFDRLAVELASLALWEACRDLPLTEHSVPSYSGDQTSARRLAERVGGVIILRAGLLFAAPFRRLLANAPLYQIGLRRDEDTLEASAYTCNLPSNGGWADRVMILDPMLATGGTAVSALERVRKGHAGPIDIVSLIAAPLGVEMALKADSACRVVTVALDERLDERGYIQPGLGDAGDRLFGTAPR